MYGKYFELLKQGGADLAMRIEASSVVTAPWTIYKCRYGCGTYGKSHCCPPNCPTWKETQEILDAYRYGILFRCHDMNLVTPLAVEAARELFLDDYYKAIAFGSGPCKKCAVCNPDHCNFPGKTAPSMEACGIDVFATVRGLGLEIHTLRKKGETQNHFGLILVE
ncbi:MAG: DUF2284 domain-containing protein [Oscillospiraceae bacterium]|nr:DUF2284 domain-containing protein [Oscillospiraceae bacterium]